jgi:Mg-chelatase subunit ChlD
MMHYKTMKHWLSACLIAWLPTLSQAYTEPPVVKMQVSPATPLVEAGKQQTAFVKISLTGFEQTLNTERPPVNVAVVLDRSGSMAGEKLNQAKQAAILATQRLGKNDIISVVAYGSDVEVVLPATRMTDRETIEGKIQAITSDGNTALFAGVSKGADEVRKFMKKDSVNRVILLSDGLANVGPQSPTELGALGASLGKEGISVTTIGLGLGYNEDLMTRLAGYSDGNHAVDTKYFNLASQQRDQLRGVAEIAFSASQEEIRANIDKNAYVDVVGQIANEYAKDAVSRRDRGDIEGAKRVLQENARFVEEKNRVLPAPSAALTEQAEEFVSDAEIIEDKKKWGSQRKELRAKQYKRERQQTY